MRPAAFLFCFCLATFGAVEDPAAEVAPLADAYREAFLAGDAAALARCFAADGEYTDRAGAVHRGREAVERLARAFFEECPGATFVSDRQECRRLPGGIVVREGVVTVREGDGRVRSLSRFTSLLAREDGRWAIASLTEEEPRAGDFTARERMEPLAWLAGEWVEDSDHARIRTTCRFSEDGPFLVQHVTHTDREGKVGRRRQHIAYDPVLRTFRSWSWDSEGGFGESIWSPTEDGFLLRASGVTAEGESGTGLFRLRCVSADVFTWENLSEPGEPRVIVRKPPEPGEVK